MLALLFCRFNVRSAAQALSLQVPFIYLQQDEVLRADSARYSPIEFGPVSTDFSAPRFLWSGMAA